MMLTLILLLFNNILTLSGLGSVFDYLQVKIKVFLIVTSIHLARSNMSYCLQFVNNNICI